MTLVSEDMKLPVGSEHPMAYDNQPTDRYHYAIRAYYEDFWGKPEESKRPIVLYFHGSGATGPQSPKSDLVKGVLFQGMNFFSCQYFGTGLSSPNPFPFGYYNVNAPRYLDLFIKTGWWVKTCIDYVRSKYPDNPVVVYGHSMGASASLSYAAGYTGFEPDKSIKGILSSGATIGSLGNGTWNDIWRNISVMSGIVHLVRDIKTLMVHADDDPYGPPEYSRRLQIALPKDSPIYPMSAGTGGHAWASSNPRLVIKWLTELLYDEDITDRFGNLAVRGPTGNC